MAEINNTQNTEAIPVVSVSIDPVLLVHLAVKKYLPECKGFRVIPGHFFISQMRFWGISNRRA